MVPGSARFPILVSMAMPSAFVTNDRPRKALDWETPAERWARLLCAT